MDSPNTFDAPLPWRVRADELHRQAGRARPLLEAADAWLDIALQPLGEQQRPMPRLSTLFGELTRARK
jgi:hypothetical protein